eukprot:Lithocolla_globosa_v1_NODE_115_length_6172_cov_14.462155.p10 type:complete len:109 gc:universal NODE_115_length_6172_cov_14.462155:5103-4777(-)
MSILRLLIKVLISLTTFSRMRLGFAVLSHKFNTIENQNYIGSYPAVEYYEPGRMSAQGRTEFLAWHASKTDEVYNFQHELVLFIRRLPPTRRHALLQRELCQGLWCRC